MDLLHDTPLEFGTVVSRLTPHEPSLVAVVKATYDISPGGELSLADKQRPPSGDSYHDAEPERSLKDASDFAPVKPYGECLVSGSAHAPEGRPVPRLRAGFRVGDLVCQFEVVGDRTWRRGWSGRSPGEAAAFSEMPLVWERAFGGPGCTENPVGRGMGDAGLLPNIERVDAPMLAPRDRPRPVCPAPIAPTWVSRQRHAGTYRRRWERDRFPWLAADFDVRFFMASSREQWAGGYFRGEERIELEGLHPQASRVRTRLPRITPRVFASTEGRFDEVGLVLDTLVIDADAGQLLMTWRGLVRVADDDASDLRRLRVVHEEGTLRRPADAYRPKPPRTPTPRPAPAPLRPTEPPPAPCFDETPPGAATSVPDARPLYGPRLPTEEEQEAQLEAELAKLRAVMVQLGVETPSQRSPVARAEGVDLSSLRGMLAQVDFLNPSQVDELLAGFTPETEAPETEAPETEAPETEASPDKPAG